MTDDTGRRELCDRIAEGRGSLHYPLRFRLAQLLGNDAQLLGDLIAAQTGMADFQRVNILIFRWLFHYEPENYTEHCKGCHRPNALALQSVGAHLL
ncbi:hypothetical protein [Rhizobium nepotum]|uniref:hypothetical protein n=1 Tax=Rhizobium nepotum TaxID=1035271 RepID=UPI003CF93D98